MAQAERNYSTTPDRPKRRRALRRLNATQRRRVEVAVEAMIEALDAIDGDENLEPSLGYQSSRHVDVEDEHNGAEPGVDDEPSLGSFDRMTNQERSYRQRQGSTFYYDDAEHDPADREDDEREDDPAERSGIGDKDGLGEQTRDTSSLWGVE